MPELIWTVDALRPKIVQFLDPVLKASGLELSFDVRDAGSLRNPNLISPDLMVAFEGRDLDLLLAYRAELLLALEQLTMEALRVPHYERYKLIFDANDYRMMRIEELRLSAVTAADKVKSAGGPFRFHPMTSRERRIIHLALRDDPDVTTVSEGVAPNRHTVVYSAERK